MHGNVAFAVPRCQLGRDDAKEQDRVWLDLMVPKLERYG